MESTAALNQPRSAGLVLHLLESIHSFEKKISGPRLLLARYYRVTEHPRLQWEGNLLKWEFDVRSNGMPNEAVTTHVQFELNPNLLKDAWELGSILHTRSTCA